MLKNLLDACGSAISFYAVGYAFAFGSSDPESSKSTFIGNGNFFLMGDVNAAYFFFQYAFSATSATIVAGTLAERCKMAAYLCYSFYLTGFVYPVVAHTICE
jgi:ammonium transporter, Amt family